MDKKTSPALVMIGAKVPAEVRERIEKKAAEEDRTVSKVIARLLASHPEISLKKEKAAA